jgi:hypothetical protein
VNIHRADGVIARLFMAINANATIQVVVQVRGHAFELITLAAQNGRVVLLAHQRLQRWEQPHTAMQMLINIRQCWQGQLSAWTLFTGQWCTMVLVCHSWLLVALMHSIDLRSEQCLCHPVLHFCGIH